MANQAKDLGLKCPNKGTFYACPDAEASFIGCCTTDPCEDNSGNCPESDLVAATFDPDDPVQDFSHECLDGEWYDCPDLETPFVGCCSRDACLSRCPVENLRAAVLGDHNGLIFKMAVAESTDDSASTKSTATSQATSTGETTDTSSLFTSVATTVTDVPTGTTSSSGVAEKTVVVADPQGKDDLSDSQEVGIAVTAGVIGFIIIGCIVHRVIVHNRKRRPGYPHRTDHDPLWQPPDSPIELNSINAPGTRKCGLDRVPGEATRPGSWDDAANNAAEAELTGLPGPRRVRSAEPAALLNSAASQASGQGRVSGQLSQHSLPLPDVRGRPVDGPRSAGSAGPQFKGQHRSQDWVTGKEHAEHYGHYSDNGDFSVNIEGYGQGALADRQHRHLAARSDDQLSRFVPYPPAAEVRSVRSNGPGQSLNLDHYALKAYEPYTPLAGPSGRQAQGGASKVDRPREVYELPAKPVGKLSDPRAGVMLGEMRVLNPDPRESTVIDTEEVKDKAEINSGELTGDVLAARRASIFGEPEDFSKPKAKNSDEKLVELEEEGEKQAAVSSPGVSSAATEKSASRLGVTEVASIPRLMAASVTVPKAADKKVVSEEEAQAPGAAASAAWDAEEAPRLDATGGLPTLASDSPRPMTTTSAPSVTRGYKKPYVTDEQSGVSSEATRPSSLNAGVSSAAEDTQRPTVADILPTSRHSSLTTSSAAPASFAPQREPLRFPDLSAPPPLPRVLAAPRRQTSELHMNVLTDAARQNPGHPSADRQFAESAGSPLQEPTEYPARVPAPRAELPTALENGMYESRYPAQPTSHGQVHRTHDRGQLNAFGPRIALGHRSNHNEASQANSQTRQPYAQAYHTRIYHPHRVNPQQPVVQPPANSTRPRRTVGEPNRGTQPQPAYRSYQGRQDLSRGNAIAPRDVGQQSPAYRPGAYSSADYGSYDIAERQYAASVPRSEYSETSDNRQTHGHGSEIPSHVHSYFSTRRDLSRRP